MPSQMFSSKKSIFSLANVENIFTLTAKLQFPQSNKRRGTETE